MDAWNNANDPDNFARDYNYNWDNLNKPELAQGASVITPWPDTCWPMKKDGYNQRWQGGNTLSPVELYDKAFNNWVPEGGFDAYRQLTRFISPGVAYDGQYYEKYGKATKWAHIKGGNYRARILTSPDGEPLWDQENNQDNLEWGGIEDWWCHNHAWAAAAIMAPEPQNAVTIKGVTFEVADIKALINATYEGGRNLFLGNRCNTKEVQRDEHGRIMDSECRDVNPGAFHVVTLNRMGIRKLSFVIDATYDFEVWNQPCLDYEIEQQEEVDLRTALELLGRTDASEYPYNANAKRFVHVKMKLRYVVAASASKEPYRPIIDNYTRTHNYDYLLELKENGEIDGGEWIEDQPHPDFIWAPTGANSVREGWYGEILISVENVQRLIDLSTSSEVPSLRGNVHYYMSTPGAIIPDSNPNGISDTIKISDALTISSMTINVDITHTYQGDLIIKLIDKDNTSVTLLDGEGGYSDDVHQTFAVSAFNGQNACGDWTLKVIDTAGIDTGTLDGWVITIITKSGSE
ncbi:proprotein convertase P-domain-containing protein [Thermodesulfobacteriota bacterium]